MNTLRSTHLCLKCQKNFFEKKNSDKMFETVVLKPTTLHQIFYGPMLESKVVFKSIVDPDNPGRNISRHEWVKGFPVILDGLCKEYYVSYGRVFLQFSLDFQQSIFVFLSSPHKNH